MVSPFKVYVYMYEWSISCRPSVHIFKVWQHKARIDLWEKLQKIYFETRSPTAYIFSVLQWLVVSYINPANQAPGV